MATTQGGGARACCEADAHRRRRGHGVGRSTIEDEGTVGEQVERRAGTTTAATDAAGAALRVGSTAW